MRCALSLFVMACRMLFMIHGCCRYRGAHRVPDPDQQLVMDVPFLTTWPLHLPKLLLGLVFEGTLAGEVAYKVRLEGCPTTGAPDGK